LYSSSKNGSVSLQEGQQIGGVPVSGNSNILKLNSLTRCT
jgi:hypothetical protein